MIDDRLMLLVMLSENSYDILNIDRQSQSDQHFPVQELEVIQEDLGSGYTTVRTASGEFGFLPTTSLIFQS